MAREGQGWYCVASLLVAITRSPETRHSWQKTKNASRHYSSSWGENVNNATPPSLAPAPLADALTRVLPEPNIVDPWPSRQCNTGGGKSGGDMWAIGSNVKWPRWPRVLMVVGFLSTVLQLCCLRRSSSSSASVRAVNKPGVLDR